MKDGIKRGNLFMLKKIWYIISIVAILFCTSLLHAQIEDYVLQYGDSLLIVVTGKTNFSYTDEISLQGTISIKIPWDSPPETFGTVILLRVVNLPMGEAKELIVEAFKKYLVNIEVTVNIIQFADKVYIRGEVVWPGPYDFVPNRKMNYYIGIAAGPTSKGDISKIRILKKDGREVNPDSETIIEGGDTIIVPEKKQWRWYLIPAVVVGAVVTVLLIAR